MYSNSKGASGVRALFSPDVLRFLDGRYLFLDGWYYRGDPFEGRHDRRRPEGWTESQAGTGSPWYLLSGGLARAYG